MSPLMLELRQALRSLLRSPGFALMAILTLALGLAGALALATVVHGVILRPLPYPEPHRLAAVTVDYKGEPFNVVSPTDVPDLQDGSAVCQDLLLFDSGQGTVELEVGEHVDPATALHVDWNLLANLGAKPVLGRSFLPDDPPDAVVLSYDAWRRIFGGNPDLVGRTVALDGKPCQVLGVVATGFQLPDHHPIPDVYQRLDRRQGNRGGYMLRAIARLKPGVTLAQLAADFAARSKAMAQAYPKTNQGVVYRVEDLQSYLLGDRTQSLLLALGLAGFLLLIACVNVAHLFLTRSLERRQELALRWALGASGSGLLRHHLVEGLAVGFPAAALGLGGAWLALKLVPSLLPGLPDLAGLRPDTWEILLALLLVLATSLAFALLPLRQSRDPRLGADLRSGTRTSTAAGRRTRRVLVVAESALAVVMLALGGLFLTSFLRALHRDPGYRLREGLVFHLMLPKQRYSTPETMVAFQSSLMTRLESLPGVRGAVLSSGLPNGRGMNMSTSAQAFPTSGSMEDWPTVAMVGTTPGYFAQMGIPFRSGRDIQPTDGPGSAPVAVLSELAARQLFPGRSPLGQRIQTGMGTAQHPEGMAFEVVGVCGDVVQGDIREPPSPRCYFPLSQAERRTVEVALATNDSPASLRPLIEAQVKAQDPRLPVLELTTLGALNLKRLADLHQATWLLGIFAGLGLLLGFAGVGSVVATQVASRTREIGLRMALGATVGRVLGQFVGEAMAQVGLGALLGAVLAAALGRVVAARLFDTPPTDPWVLAGAVLLFCGAAAIASFLPALRAARVHPADALRSE